jgi:hypothetical protein
LAQVTAASPQLSLPQPGALHADLARQRLYRHDTALTVVPLHVSPLLPLGQVVDPAGRVAVDRLVAKDYCRQRRR